MMGIVYATQDEARPFIHLAGMIPLENTRLPCYQNADARLVLTVCGIGKVAAALGTQYLLQRFEIGHMFHGGICGALKDDPVLQPGTVLCMAHVTEGAPGPGIPEPLASGAADLFPDLPRATLMTLERPLFDSRRRGELAREADAVDMEGAVVARVANLYDCPWTIVKGVTDMAREGDRDLIKAHIHSVSRAVAEHLWRALPQTIMTTET